MPHEKEKEHKCSHHTAKSGRSSWHNYHFSGKVIMCSVLFGLGLVLIGGLLFAIAVDDSDDSKPKDLNKNQVQTKAPMSVIGPIIIGIGSFTVIVGIAMCLFETNICRKRKPDTTPLIDEQANNAASASGAVSVPSSRREKHRHHHKKSKKHKGASTSPTDSASSGGLPSSNPINAENSRDFTASDKFMTPSSSVISDSNIQRYYENQTSVANTILSSGKSWTTSTEFQTPPSSPPENYDSFEVRKVKVNIEKSALVEPKHNKVEEAKHDFLTPKNSDAESVIAQSSKGGDGDQMKSRLLQANLSQVKDVSNLSPEPIENTHAFLTPKGSHSSVSPLDSTAEMNPVPLKNKNEVLSSKVAPDETQAMKIVIEQEASENEPVESKDNVQDNIEVKHEQNGKSTSVKEDLNTDSAYTLNDQDLKEPGKDDLVLLKESTAISKPVSDDKNLREGDSHEILNDHLSENSSSSTDTINGITDNSNLQDNVVPDKDSNPPETKVTAHSEITET